MQSLHTCMNIEKAKHRQLMRVIENRIAIEYRVRSQFYKNSKRKLYAGTFEVLYVKHLNEVI